MKVKHYAITLLGAGMLYAAPLALSVVSADIGLVQAAEQSADSTSERKTKKVPAMRNRVYSQLARAQKIADDGDKAGGLAVLDEVRQRVDSMNSYERAMLWNFYGFMYYANDDVDNAMAYFEKVVAEQAIPETLEQSTLYSLAQLAMQKEHYQQALDYLARWQQVNNKPLDANQQVLFAQVYYQDKQYAKALQHVEQAVALAEQNNAIPKENWLILQRAAYYELQQPEQVTKVMEKLVRLYDKPEYWLQLAGMYGETGAEKKQLAVMEAAWQAGYVSKASDLVTLAQLYLYHGVPYKAAKLLSESLDSGAVVRDEKHLELLAQAYIAAQEPKKALPVLVKASEIADSGKYDAQLAQAYLNLEQWQPAIKAAEKALERGGINNAGTMQLVLGMAYFNRQNFDESLNALALAGNYPESEKMAKQWTAYVKKEQGHQMRLAMAR